MSNNLEKDKLTCPTCKNVQTNYFQIELDEKILQGYQDRVEMLESKLAIAKEALEEVITAVNDPDSDCYECIAAKALSKLNEDTNAS